MSSIKKVAVIGTGVIGTGWIIRCLAHNKIVYAFDKDLKLKNSLIKEIKRTWPFVKKLFKKNKLNLKNFYYFTSLEKTLKDAEFIQELEGYEFYKITKNRSNFTFQTACLDEKYIKKISLDYIELKD